MLLAVQAHSDDIPLFAAGTVAKLVEEGYTGYLVRATNDDMGDAPGLGTPGTIGDHVLGNERDNAEVARVLGCKSPFDLNYPNHRMGDVSQNELICRLIFLIRAAQGRYGGLLGSLGTRRGESRSLQIGPRRGSRLLDGGPGARLSRSSLPPASSRKTVQDKYYYARRPEITRVVDVSGEIDQKIDANRANRAKGPAGTPARGSGPSWPSAASGCRCWATTT